MDSGLEQCKWGSAATCHFMRKSVYVDGGSPMCERDKSTLTHTAERRSAALFSDTP